MDPEPEVADGTEPETAPSPETVPTPGPEATPTPVEPEPDFTDPAKLPPEVQALGKRLQASYTKKMQKASEAVELVTRYRSDPEFARQFILYEAQRLGVIPGSPTPAQPAGAAPAGQPTNAPPPELVQTIANSLPAELRWMAPGQAAATWAGVQAQIAPIRQQLQQRDQQEKAAQAERLRADLSEKYPGWEADEEPLSEYVGWLQGEGPAVHPVYGNRLAVFYNAFKGNALAEKAALQRQSQAARAATRTGAPSRSVTPNTQERIDKAPSTRDAVALALAQAIEDARREGRTVAL